MEELFEIFDTIKESNFVPTLQTEIDRKYNDVPLLSINTNEKVYLTVLVINILIVLWSIKHFVSLTIQISLTF